ncbi:MAG: hypothetical protein EOP89_03265 [Lysobacteraceae bacterium]|nr:MAG: hypothetical protein EOP89_03265 [Xanthomonadaceae bacterium]
MAKMASARRGAERGPFAVKTEQAAHTDATVATGSVSAVSLLALQESESGLHQDREARQHGEAVIDELTELQRALLGADGPDLDRLTALVARPISASDPALAGVLRAVRLRAGIELARRGRAASM